MKTEWDSPGGRRKIESVDGDRIFIRTGDNPSLQILRRQELDREIYRDEANHASRSRARAQADAELSRQAAVREIDLHGFTDDMPQVKRSKIENTLREIQGFSGQIMKRYKFIDQAVADGAEVERSGRGRRLVLASGGFYTERDITKTAMDYAEYLIRLR